MNEDVSPIKNGEFSITILVYWRVFSVNVTDKVGTLTHFNLDQIFFAPDRLPLPTECKKGVCIYQYLHIFLGPILMQTTENSRQD